MPPNNLVFHKWHNSKIFFTLGIIQVVARRQYSSVTSNAMTTVQHQTTVQKMNRKANASAKSKEVQRHPQADTQLHHICFCPTALRNLTTFRF